jgi:FOG: CheY-like receiver
MHILIAEDNNINLMLITFMVQSFNCTFDTAINGYEAMKLLTTKNYQLALIDINMPLINGFELIQSIRKQNMTLPVIAISAYSDKTNIGKALSLGFDNYLTKPIDQQKLKEMIYNYE